MVSHIFLFLPIGAYPFQSLVQSELYFIKQDHLEIME